MISNKTDFSGWTPLHWAAFRCQKEEVTRLLVQSADPNVKDSEGWTPIVCAFFGDMQIFNLQFGSKKDRKVYRNHHRECREIIEALIASGANLSATTIGGVTTLGVAKLMGQAEFAALIQRHGGKCKRPWWKFWA